MKQCGKAIHIWQALWERGALFMQIASHQDGLRCVSVPSRILPALLHLCKVKANEAARSLWLNKCLRAYFFSIIMMHTLTLLYCEDVLSSRTETQVFLMMSCLHFHFRCELLSSSEGHTGCVVWPAVSDAYNRGVTSTSDFDPGWFNQLHNITSVIFQELQNLMLKRERCKD